MSTWKHHYREFIKGFAAGILLVCIIYGLFKAIQRVTSEEGRNPAAIDKAHIFDVSYLEGGALKEASAKQLLQNAEVKIAKDDITVSLGHFVAKSPTGERRLLCDIYDRVELSFLADGMAVNGEQPQLVVTGPCEPSQNLNRTNPIHIPFVDILNQKVGEGEFTFGTTPDHVFKATHVSGQWPEQWILSEVKLVNKTNPATFLWLDRRDVYKFSSKPIVLNWQRK
jgi:hypothetical protein